MYVFPPDEKCRAKSPVAILASLDFAEKPFRTGGSLEKTLNECEDKIPAAEEPVAGNCGRNILGADNNFPRGIKDRENMIAKAVFRDGYLTSEFERIRAALIVQLQHRAW